MSRTDKDRPYWVVSHQETQYIDHDHRNGECVIETLDVAKFYDGSRGYRPKHWRNCSKRVVIEWTCTKKDPYTYAHSAYLYRNGTRFRAGQECWMERCRCDVAKYRRHTYEYGGYYSSQSEDCPTWGRVQCVGHSRTETDWSIHCVCDDWPERPTCEPSAGSARPRYRYGGCPNWYVQHIWTNPERVRERDDLRGMAREYNAYGDIEEDDFDNRQHHHMASWYYW